nr:hypothetical protein [Tanacetum cinerariifolium]
MWLSSILRKVSSVDPLFLPYESTSLRLCTLKMGLASHILIWLNLIYAAWKSRSASRPFCSSNILLRVNAATKEVPEQTRAAKMWEELQIKVDKLS